MQAYIVPGIMIMICVLSDIRTRTVPVWIMAIGGLMGGVVSYITKTVCIRDIILGMVLGMLILIFAYLSKQGIGYGDALLFMSVGAGVGVWREVFLMWVPFFVAGIFGLVIMLAKHKNKDYEMPFVPFLGGAYALMFCLETVV